MHRESLFTKVSNPSHIPLTPFISLLQPEARHYREEFKSSKNVTQMNSTPGHNPISHDSGV